MRKRSLLMYIWVASFMVVTNTQAAKLIFDNNQEDVDITGDVTINNQNGNVTVTTQDGNFLIVPEDQPVILGFFPEDYDILSGETVGVSWVVANADTCTANTVGSNSSWSGNKPAVDGRNPAAGPDTVSFTSLPATLQLTCSNAEFSTMEQFTVTEQQGTISTNPIIEYFRVNGNGGSNVNVVGPNATVVMSWSTRDVSNCTAGSSPNLPGWTAATSIPTSGQTSALSISEDTVITLDCDDLPVRQININYQDNVDPACATIPGPQNVPEGPNRITYTTLNDGFAFGTSDDTNAIADFKITEYMEISGLTTTNQNYRRKLQIFPTPSNFNSPFAVTLSISSCPGDFNTATAACVKGFNPLSFPQVRISTNPNDPDPGACIITPGESYYLNLIHDQDPFDGQPGRCFDTTKTSCAVFFNELEDQ